jgi:hypothetical protein
MKRRCRMEKNKKNVEFVLRRREFLKMGLAAGLAAGIPVGIIPKIGSRRAYAEVTKLAEALEKIPAETRWEMATKGLTGAWLVVANALKDAVDEEKWNEFNRGLWYQTGKGAKEFADTLGLTAESPRDIHEVMGLLAMAGMGPEFELEVVEATEDRCVGRTSKCPWHERWKELGLKWDFCSVGHQGWNDGGVESLNPNFTYKLTKNMVRGDPYCEWIIERKR